MPEELAPEARELLVAFMRWASHPNQAGLVDDDRWTWPQMIDVFLLEASTVIEEEVPDGG